MAALTVAVLLGFTSLAAAEDRSLKLYFVHTGEKATITYKRNGRFDQAGLQKVNRLLRDWRRNESGRMDPRLLDIVWEIYKRSNTRNYIHVVSGYRSPATNAKLRGRSRATGVAKKSLHMQGKAMDFFIPGVKLSTLRRLAIQMQAGGVGYYPTSGSPFIHVDVGGVRAWPRMTRQELIALFPDGRTLHLPPDGRHLPGYDVALADYKRRVGPQSIQVASRLASSNAPSRAKSDSGRDADPTAEDRDSLLTAMLPLPKSRPPRPFLDDEDDAESVDVVALTVPAPILRPAVSDTPTDAIVTASIGVIPSARPTPQMPAPTNVTAALLDRPAGFNRVAADHGTAFREPQSSIASLPFEAVEADEEDELDSMDLLIGWAISPPDRKVAMLAPGLTDRLLMDHTAKGNGGGSIASRL
ncbi:DUF882 domain-containing protein [Agrobacterium tumefaciens]|uniref:DUF882 domain-containing protein n=1 Tax=Agrobacterium tumefaciens TaxID=358 RepID=UPI0021D0CAE4|nr:DUF882 domain-containing protein [Agrobacterium tumefaciens]